MSITLRVDERGGIALPADLRKRLGVEPGAVLQAEETPSGLLLRTQPTASSSRPSILDEFDRILAELPAEEHAKLPEDGAEQHDHYIYGTPKRNPNGDK